MFCFFFSFYSLRPVGHEATGAISEPIYPVAACRLPPFRKETGWSKHITRHSYRPFLKAGLQCCLSRCAWRFACIIMVCLLSSSPKSHHPSTRCNSVFLIDLPLKGTAFLRIGVFSSMFWSSDTLGEGVAAGGGMASFKLFTAIPTPGMGLGPAVFFSRMGAVGGGGNHGAGSRRSVKGGLMNSSSDAGAEPEPEPMTAVPSDFRPPAALAGRVGGGGNLGPAAVAAFPPFSSPRPPPQASTSLAGGAAVCSALRRRQRQAHTMPEKAKSTHRAMLRPHTALTS